MSHIIISGTLSIPKMLLGFEIGQTPYNFQSSRSEGAFDDNFSYFSSKPYVVTPHLNCLIKTVQMKGNNICFMQI